MASIVFDQLECAGVIEQCLVRCEECETFLEVFEVLVVEDQRCDRVHEELRVIVEVGGFDDPVVSAVGQKLAPILLLVLGVYVWVNAVYDAVAMALADGMCTWR